MMQEFVKTVMKDGRMQGALLVGETDLGITLFYSLKFKMRKFRIWLSRAVAIVAIYNSARKYGFIGDIL
jgi:hypothetical protein